MLWADLEDSDDHEDKILDVYLSELVKELFEFVYGDTIESQKEVGKVERINHI